MTASGTPTTRRSAELLRRVERLGRRRERLFPLATLLLLAVAVIDTVTGPDLAFSIFYLVPVSLVAWSAGPRSAVFFALVAAGAWLSADLTSGATYSHRLRTVSCSAVDQAGNTATGSFKVNVVDTTAPSLKLPADIIEEATKAAGADISFAASASDIVDGTVPVDCTPTSGGTFDIRTSVVTCSTEDRAGNKASGTFNVTVKDTTAPAVNVPEDIQAWATSASGAPVSYAATASDVVDGDVNPTCSPASASTFAPGETTVTCTAKDKAGNTSAPKTFKVAVRFGFNGFFAPIDRNKVLNSMKAGSTAPIKWSVSNTKGGYIGDLSIVDKATSGVVDCTAGGVPDTLDNMATGGTQLRYDTTANQYIYNWQSPSKAGTCYQVNITFKDGKTQSAIFQLR